VTYHSFNINNATALRLFDGGWSGSCTLVHPVWSQMFDALHSRMENDEEHLVNQLKGIVFKSGRKSDYQIFSAGYFLSPHLRVEVQKLKMQDPKELEILKLDTLDILTDMFRRTELGSSVARGFVLKKSDSLVVEFTSRMVDLLDDYILGNNIFEPKNMGFFNLKAAEGHPPWTIWFNKAPL
jgi:hypothetical protein